VFNTGAAQLSGVEIEAAGYLGPNLLLRFDYAYLDAEIEDVPDPFTGEQRSFGLDNAPRNSASVSLDYSLAKTTHGDWRLNLNASYVDERNTANTLLTMNAYSLLNGRLSLSGIDLGEGELALAAWVKNALDEHYVNFTIGNLPHASRAVLWGEPRSWGLELRYDYR
jgi:iron complex outermembrane receptor protein